VIEPTRKKKAPGAVRRSRCFPEGKEAFEIFRTLRPEGVNSILRMNPGIHV
jgi:hypothetical protein